MVYFCLLQASGQPVKINRKAVVQRHNIDLTQPDTLASITLGNGAFAFTVDITGLQTFYKDYQNGVPLGTQSEWGWHRFPNTRHFQRKESYRYIKQQGREVPYTVQSKTTARTKAASDYFRLNPHRLQLGNIGLVLLKKNGKKAVLADLKNVHQHFDLWTGQLTSQFTLQGEPVTVYTYGNADQDGVAFRVVSPLMAVNRLWVRVAFPYPTTSFSDKGTHFDSMTSHQSHFTRKSQRAGYFIHQLDTTRYFVNVSYDQKVQIDSSRKHFFLIRPTFNDKNQKQPPSFAFSAVFSQKRTEPKDLSRVAAGSAKMWTDFWRSGGAIDFNGSTDPRANELERRIILSEYLTRVQYAGHFAPQETGLTYNSWYGHQHLEMYWWHSAHFALWGRPKLLEKSLDWYFQIAGKAAQLARRQGYKGVRWQKMTDNQGQEAPSSVGAFLIWQQPHFIYLAELLYRQAKDPKILNKYKDLVFKTADFMASFATMDSATGYYNLGPGIIPAQECFEASKTFNPTYELSYWSWGLKTALEWKKRLGLPVDTTWANVLAHLAPLPEKNGVYLATQSTPDCYAPDSKVTIDHPAVLAALASLPPSDGLDTATMHRTFDLVKKIWHWDHTWGWDFPLTAMTATRLHQPHEAVDALFKKVQTNTYLPNGHNYQDKRLTIYLPGNGGLLSAIALMCAGYDGNKTVTPGFPAKGWKVAWEGLKPMP